MIMFKGSVKWFNTLRGYGFILDDSSHKDIFVHYTEIQRSDRQLQPNEKVEFEIGHNTKGDFAKNVKVS
jgi:CspA family cold shock protein